MPQLAAEQVIAEMAEFRLPKTRGITNWISEKTDPFVLDRLGSIDQNPLPKVQLNQLLALSHEGIMTDDFYRHYWLHLPERHLYDATQLPDYNPSFTDSRANIVSLAHLRWGLRRLYMDALLIYGNVRYAYRAMRGLTAPEIAALFHPQLFDTERILSRGRPLPVEEIARDDRYLISEMACKSLGEGETPDDSDLRKALLAEYKRIASTGRRPGSIKELLESANTNGPYRDRQAEFAFTADEIVDESVESEAQLEVAFSRIWSRFAHCRKAALENTRRYLSMVNDLDVYVATSMRKREDFRKVAELCDSIFQAQGLKDMNLRYFDPTLSAASGHEDKGLIECLMVRCAKALVFIAGERDSYGKDAEAAMALSQGKPVIFLCDVVERGRFYRDVHPLSRLIDYRSGNAVGAYVATNASQAVELLTRIFTNSMEYELQRTPQGSLRLRETLTDSVVRLQSGDELLNETFWNNYHNRIQ